MRTDSLIGLVCLCVFGCATEPRFIDDFSGETSALSDRIVIVATATTGGERGTVCRYRWVLNKDGKSTGTLYIGNRDESEGAVTEHEFAPGIHGECLAKFEETRFFRIKSAPPGKLDGSSSSIEIHYHGRKHVVTEIGADANSDDGLNRFWLFLGDVLKRSTVVSTRRTAA